MSIETLEVNHRVDIRLDSGEERLWRAYGASLSKKVEKGEKVTTTVYRSGKKVVAKFIRHIRKPRGQPKSYFVFYNQ